MKSCVSSEKMRKRIGGKQDVIREVHDDKDIVTISTGGEQPEFPGIERKWSPLP